jgi:tRNA-splicing ligase RtcB (3'-phosphate/5'-hydroxy nucleic acid ligase)
MSDLTLRRLDDELWELPVGARPGMRVPGRRFADADLLAAIARDHSLEQLANVATLPGIVEAALAMPDIHQGYGFPVGGVAATAGPDAVVSPGGVGYDINCGVRLLALPVDAGEIGKHRDRLVGELARRVPVGTGGRGALEGVSGVNLDRVLALGPRALLDDLAIGTEADVEFTESRGRLDGADPGAVSPRALPRSRPAGVHPRQHGHRLLRPGWP